MKMSELSARSGRSVATIKYYLREGLLPPGRRTAANQADYSEDHLHRLRLVTTLIDVGGLSVTAVSAVLDAIDDDELPLHEALGVAHYGLASRGVRIGAIETDSEDEIDGFLETLGWRVGSGAPAKGELAAALAALRQLGWDVGPEVFYRYAQAADELAEWELTQIPAEDSRARAVEGVVVGTIVFEAALIALRRLAQEHHSAGRFAGSTPSGVL